MTNERTNYNNVSFTLFLSDSPEKNSSKFSSKLLNLALKGP